VVYEGVFHGCALEGDFSITLKSARSLPSGHSKSGAVIGTLIIPGKDFLQVSAIDVPSPELLEDGNGAVEGGAFATDAEIRAKRGDVIEDRELVAWSGDGDDGGGGINERLDRHGSWGVKEMFAVNEEKFGISTTFDEDLYTTKLDPNSIPREKREEAERIAKEIEKGQNHTDMEDLVDDDGDEEARFSAVSGTGAYKNRGSSALTGSSDAAPSGKARVSAAANRPVSETAAEAAASSNALTIPGMAKAGSQAAAEGGDAARDYRRQRGMIVAHSPMMHPLHNSMISEMKRINALNLEPAVPKLDDKTGNDWINFKQSQTRSKTNPSQGDSLKKEFEQALEVIQRRERQGNARQQQPQQDQLVATGSGDASGSRKQEMATSSGTPSNFKFNTNAKEFSFNPSAATFTPTASSSGVAAAAPASHSDSAPAGPPVKTSGPAFNVQQRNEKLLKMNLDTILDGFARSSHSADTLGKDLSWTEAKGPLSFKEILGQPNPTYPMGPNSGTMPGQWQQPGIGQMGAPAAQAPGQPAGQQMMMPQGNQGQMGAPGAQGQGQPGAPQMMGQQGGFMMANAPSGQPQPMQFQPMYPAPGSGNAPMRPPQGGQQMPQQGQQQMVFNQQGGQMAMPGGQQMGMPSNMVPVQGNQNQGGINMQNMPKFGMPPQGMVMMVPTGGQMPQGVPTNFQGQPGQPGPPGQPGQPGQQGNPPGGPQMMRPMYHGQMQGGQMGGGGPPHQMPGHDG
jgi:hypothetical protein